MSGIVSTGLIQLSWQPDTLEGDLVKDANGLTRDDTLGTAVYISLFTDKLAPEDAELLNEGERRGWVGDALSTVDGDQLGSWLWLLGRRKQTEQTRLDAIAYVEDALAWMVEEKLTSSVSAEADWIAPQTLGLVASIVLTDSTIRRFKFAITVGG